MTTSSTYSLKRPHLVLSHGRTERPYVLTIRDMPAEDKPREKMLAIGPHALSTRELLAAILVTGTKKEDVLTMASRIMREYGDTSIMHSTNPKTLAKNLDIPVGKAAQIVAAAELGRRFFNQSRTAPIIRTAADVFEHVKEMSTFKKEHLRGLYLNTHYKLIHDEVLSIGTIDANIIHPREVFAPALEYAAAAVILVHNHPSGSLEASESDRSVTEQVIAAGRMLGIELIDHIIVSENGYASVPAQYSV